MNTCHTESGAQVKRECWFKIYNFYRINTSICECQGKHSQNWQKGGIQMKNIPSSSQHEAREENTSLTLASLISVPGNHARNENRGSKAIHPQQLRLWVQSPGPVQYQHRCVSWRGCYFLGVLCIILTLDHCPPLSSLLPGATLAPAFISAFSDCSLLLSSPPSTASSFW